MPNPLAISVAASAAQAASGTSSALDLLDVTLAPDQLPRGAATLLLEVTAISGTGAMLDVSIETSPGGSSWKPVLAFDPIADVGYQRLKFGPLERYLHARWVISGSAPSITFSVIGLAEVVYADHEDFYGLGLPRAAVGITDPPDLLTRCLLSASSEANAQISRGSKLPLSWPIPDSLKKAVCEIAAYKFLSQRGFDPNDAADAEVKDNSDGARAWLSGISTGKTTPDWIDATPNVTDSSSYLVTNNKRGW